MMLLIREDGQTSDQGISMYYVVLMSGMKEKKKGSRIIVGGGKST